ncbi:MAG: hypothetical protein MJZ67_00030 [Bacteroidales bacterium]|nr:hypothetical protein [Bacteroidales bacterium]
MKKFFKNPSLVLVSLVVFFLTTNFISTVQQIMLLLVTDLVILSKDRFLAIRNKSFRFLIFFYLVAIVYSTFGYGTLSMEKFNMAFFALVSLVSMLIISHHISRFDTQELKWLLIISFVGVTICTLVTTYISFINPMAIRMYGFGDKNEGDMMEAAYYQSLGMISYPQSHAFSVAAIGCIVVMCFSRNKLLIVPMLLLWFLLVRLMFVMTITTALLVTVLVSLVVLINRFSKGNALVSFLLLAVVGVLVLSSDALLGFLQYADASNTTISVKLTDLMDSFSSGSSQGQVDFRQQLYMASINSFLSNPIFGWAKDNGSKMFVGEHSFLFDYLAYYGLFALLYFGIWWSEYKRIAKMLDKKTRNTYYLTLIPVAVLVTLKGFSVCTALPFVSFIFLQILFQYIYRTSTHY